MAQSGQPLRTQRGGAGEQQGEQKPPGSGRALGMRGIVTYHFQSSSEPVKPGT